MLSIFLISKSGFGP